MLASCQYIQYDNWYLRLSEFFNAEFGSKIRYEPFIYHRNADNFSKLSFFVFVFCFEFCAWFEAVNYRLRALNREFWRGTHFKLLIILLNIIQAKTKKREREKQIDDQKKYQNWMRKDLDSSLKMDSAIIPFFLLSVDESANSSSIFPCSIWDGMRPATIVRIANQ